MREAAADREMAPQCANKGTYTMRIKCPGFDGLWATDTNPAAAGAARIGISPANKAAARASQLAFDRSHGAISTEDARLELLGH